MRVALFTNLTARASLPILQQLATSADLELAHIYFYDTLAASRSSPLVVLRQFGLKKLLSKSAEVVLGKIRIKLGALLSSPLQGTRWLMPRSTFEGAVFGKHSWSIVYNMNHADSIEHLRQLGVDVLLVCVCKNILQPAVLELASPQCLNIHPSLLPNYRGPSPTFWMLYHGETQTGYTIHRMTEKIDHGEILAQRALPLNRHQSELEIELQVFAAAAADLDATLLRLNLDGKPSSRIEYDESGAIVRADTAQGTVGSYHTYPNLDDRRELRKRLAETV